MGFQVRVIEIALLPKQLVESMLARINRWVAGEDVQLSNLSTYQDLSVLELASDTTKIVLQGVRAEIVPPPQAGR